MKFKREVMIGVKIICAVPVDSTQLLCKLTVNTTKHISFIASCFDLEKVIVRLKCSLQNIKLTYSCFPIGLRPQFYKSFLHVAVQCGLKINNYSDFTRTVCC